ncbi:hypothetical protein NL676_008687 [Syzygium grande]|nr:hypothetical protein NL676_008687 [Syzygium grande]
MVSLRAAQVVFFMIHTWDDAGDGGGGDGGGERGKGRRNVAVAAPSEVRRSHISAKDPPGQSAFISYIFFGI